MYKNHMKIIEEYLFSAEQNQNCTPNQTLALSGVRKRRGRGGIDRRDHFSAELKGED